ncbi:autotransporter strand-loop-strand O-heptosyltransferase, partial [Escherichia coli]|nr:autotransporter strand-loop-strand O-heptosyltransferase [Escherichia coli]
PWRVFNSHGCNGCWDDTSLNFDHKDFLWCPRHKDTPRQYECTRLITGRQVNGVIDRLHLALAEQNGSVTRDKKGVTDE